MSAKEQVADAKDDVAAAEKVTAAEGKVTAAKADVAAAQADVAAAEAKVTTAKEDYLCCNNDRVKPLLEQAWTLALTGLDGALKSRDGAQEFLSAQQKRLTELQKAYDTASDNSANDRILLHALTQNGFAPLFQSAEGEASNTTPSENSPHTKKGPTRWAVGEARQLNVAGSPWHAQNLKLKSVTLAKFAAFQERGAQLQGLEFGPESELTGHLKDMATDTAFALGAHNLTWIQEAAARNCDRKTLKVDTWGFVDLSAFTDHGEAATLTEVKNQALLRKKNPFTSAKTAEQIYGYLSWYGIDMGVQHPLGKLQVGGKACLVYRDCDKAWAEDVMAMTFEERKNLWPARLHATEAPSTPRRNQNGGGSNDGQGDSPEPKTPIASRGRLPVYRNRRRPEGDTADIVGGSGGGGGGGSGGGGGGSASGGGGGGSSGGSDEDGSTQILYRSAIYQITDLHGWRSEARRDDDTRAGNEGLLVDPGTGHGRFLNYAALMSAALATGEKTKPQLLDFSGKVQLLRVATYLPGCTHPNFNERRWTLRFGTPTKSFKSYSVLRPLGCGADGIVHLVAGAAPSEREVAVCVAKRYHDGETALASADKECIRATKISKGVLDRSHFSVRNIGDYVAFFMPYFEPVRLHEREDFLESPRCGAMLDRIAQAGLKPCFRDNEVHWRHIGLFKNEEGVHATMIDLLRFEDEEVPDVADKTSKEWTQWQQRVAAWQNRVVTILRKRAGGEADHLSDQDVLQEAAGGHDK